MPHFRARGQGNPTRAAAARALPLALTLFLILTSTPTASAAGDCGIATGSVACDAWNNLSDRTSDFQAWLAGLTEEARELLSDPLGFLKKVVAQLITDIFRTITHGIARVANAGGAAVASLFDGLGERLTAMKDRLYATGIGAGRTVLGLIESAYTTTSGAFAPLGLFAPVVASFVVAGMIGGIVVGLAWLVGAIKTAAGTYLTGGIVK